MATTPLGPSSASRRNSLDFGMRPSLKDADGQPIRASPSPFKKQAASTPTRLLGMSGGPQRVIKPGAAPPRTPGGSICGPIPRTPGSAAGAPRVPASGERSEAGAAPSLAVEKEKSPTQLLAADIAASVAANVAEADAAQRFAPIPAAAADADGADDEIGPGHPLALGTPKSIFRTGSRRQNVFDAIDSPEEAVAWAADEIEQDARAGAPSCPLSSPLFAGVDDDEAPPSVLRSGARREAVEKADDDDDDDEISALDLSSTPRGCVVRLEAVRATGAVRAAFGPHCVPTDVVLTPVRRSVRGHEAATPAMPTATLLDLVDYAYAPNAALQLDAGELLSGVDDADDAAPVKVRVPAALRPASAASAEAAEEAAEEAEAEAAEAAEAEAEEAKPKKKERKPRGKPTPAAEVEPRRSQRHKK